jgi:hypothetical protein
MMRAYAAGDDSGRSLLNNVFLGRCVIIKEKNISDVHE